MRQDAGFTLIEVILSLILASIMAAVAGMGIVSFAKGFVLVKKSTQTAQKAQLAMARLNRELMEITDIKYNNDSVPPKPFTYIIYDNRSGRHSIAKNDTEIKMVIDIPTNPYTPPTLPTDGDVLIDNVASFTLEYYQNYQSVPKVSWVLGDNINLLTAIRFEFTISGVGGSFSTIVSPRNI
jgi:prepilin-type N-terminal cleavage/methylation domain-containing protein